MIHPRLLFAPSELFKIYNSIIVPPKTAKSFYLFYYENTSQAFRFQRIYQIRSCWLGDICWLFRCRFLAFL